MLKLKKIIRSSICLIILVAFAGAIPFEFEPAPTVKPGTEISKTATYSGFNFQLVSEERDGWDDHDHDGSMPAFLVLYSVVFPSLMFIRTTGPSSHLKNTAQQFLYISFRSLRL